MESWRRHGFPPGFRFVPKDGELIGLLATKLRDEPLPMPASVFHDIDVLECNPPELYDNYKKYMEDGYIYLFSERTFTNPNGNKKRPTRATKHGGAWKGSGADKAIVARNGAEIGRMRTMIYYVDRIDEKTGRVKKACDRTELAMQEFITTHPRTGKVADLALYRIYMKEGNNRRRKERCEEDTGSSTASVHQDDDQSMDDGVAVSGGQSQCAGVVTAVYGQGQFFEPCVPTSTAAPVEEGQPDEKREVMKNKPGAMDDVSDQCYGTLSALAQPYYNYPCAAPAAVPSHLLAHQQPSDEGVYRNGVGYDSSAGAARLEGSSGLETAAGVSDEHFGQIKKTQELADQMPRAELNAWSPNDIRAAEQFHIGTGNEDGAAPAEPWAAEHCRVGTDPGDCAAEHCHVGSGFENGAPMDYGGGGGVDDNLSCTLDFLEHGDGGNLGCELELELEIYAQFLDD